MEAKKPKYSVLWKKVREAVLHKGGTKSIERLSQNFFTKQEEDLGKKCFTNYCLPGTSAPFLRIKKLAEMIEKKQLLASCKNPIDFTGSISMMNGTHFDRNLAMRRNSCLLLLQKHHDFCVSLSKEFFFIEIKLCANWVGAILRWLG